jgi:hypothetical protein
MKKPKRQTKDQEGKQKRNTRIPKKMPWVRFELTKESSPGRENQKTRGVEGKGRRGEG